MALQCCSVDDVCVVVISYTFGSNFSSILRFAYLCLAVRVRVSEDLRRDEVLSFGWRQEDPADLDDCGVRDVRRQHGDGHACCREHGDDPYDVPDAR